MSDKPLGFNTVDSWMACAAHESAVIEGRNTVIFAAKALDAAAQDPAADLSALLDALFAAVGKLREAEDG